MRVVLAVCPVALPASHIRWTVVEAVKAASLRKRGHAGCGCQNFADRRGDGAHHGFLIAGLGHEPLPRADGATVRGASPGRGRPMSMTRVLARFCARALTGVDAKPHRNPFTRLPAILPCAGGSSKRRAVREPPCASAQPGVRAVLLAGTSNSAKSPRRQWFEAIEAAYAPAFSRAIRSPSRSGGRRTSLHHTSSASLMFPTSVTRSALPGRGTARDGFARQCIECRFGRQVEAGVDRHEADRALHLNLVDHRDQDARVLGDVITWLDM